MAYFKDFPREIYQFANGDNAIMQNLSVYVDVVDQVKENSAFYQDYYIRDGDRPDNVAHLLYRNPGLHWTFFIMNDRIRDRGWPLSKLDIIEKAKKDFPYITLNTRNDIHSFLKDTEIQGSISGATGKVVRIDTNLGQIVIDPTSEVQFVADDVVSDVSGAVTQTPTLLSVEFEYLSAHHYQVDGEVVDYRTKEGWNDSAFEVTNVEHYQSQNEELRQIRVIKPSSVNLVSSMFKRAIRS